MPKVQVKYLAPICDIAGTYRETLAMEDGATTMDLIDLLCRKYGKPVRELFYPGEGSVFIISQALSPEFQRIRLEAVAQSGLREVIIYVDGEEVARFDNAPYLTWWELTPGEHRVWAEGILPDGERVVSAVIVFTVR